MDAISGALQWAATAAALVCGVGLLVWVSLHAMLAVQALGQAAALGLTGHPVRLIEAGAGYRLFQMSLGLTLIRWRLTPSGGGATIYRPFRFDRGVRLLPALGGCAANLLAILALFVALDGRTDQERAYLLFLIVGQFLGFLRCFRLDRRIRRARDRARSGIGGG